MIDEYSENTKNIVFYSVVLLTILILFFINFSLLFDGFPGDIINNQHHHSSQLKRKNLSEVSLSNQDLFIQKTRDK